MKSISCRSRRLMGSRPGDQDQRGSVGRKSSHEGSASRAGRESRHSLSTRHWIGSKSEGRHSALRCRGGGVGLALINNAIGAIATAGGAVRSSLTSAPLRRWMWSCLNRWFPTLRLFDHIADREISAADPGPGPPLVQGVLPVLSPSSPPSPSLSTTYI